MNILLTLIKCMPSKMLPTKQEFCKSKILERRSKGQNCQDMKGREYGTEQCYKKMKRKTFQRKE